MSTNRASIRLVLFALPVLGFAGSQTAFGLSCGDTITADTTFTDDLLDCPDTGLIVGASGITIDGAGHVLEYNADGGDNCVFIDNTSQRDTDEDGIGNVCDPDLTQDCVVNFPDLGAFKSKFLTNDPDADFDGSGMVNIADLNIMKSYFFRAPGPSGVSNLCNP